MADTRVAREGVAVVVRGRFNPAIFSPSWFRDEQLVGEVEHRESTIEIISPNVSIFKMGWATVQVQDDVFQVSTEDPDEFERVRDVAVGVLRTLRHTPIFAMGINRDFHIRTPDVHSLNRIGDTLTPKEIWEPVLHFPGMRAVTMWGARTDLYGGRYSVQVEPSVQIPNAVYISHNDHYDLTVTEKPATDRLTAFEDHSAEGNVTADKVPVAVEILSKNWADSLISAERTSVMIEKLGLK